jgi:hypothetical protein
MNEQLEQAAKWTDKMTASCKPKRRATENFTQKETSNVRDAHLKEEELSESTASCCTRMQG